MHGMHEVIEPELLSMFFPDEIQLLISGGLNEIDIADLREHTTYHGYRASHSLPIRCTNTFTHYDRHLTHITSCYANHCC